MYTSWFWFLVVDYLVTFYIEENRSLVVSSFFPSMTSTLLFSSRLLSNDTEALIFWVIDMEREKPSSNLAKLLAKLAKTRLFYFHFKKWIWFLSNQNVSKALMHIVI